MIRLCLQKFPTLLPCSQLWKRKVENEKFRTCFWTVKNSSDSLRNMKFAGTAAKDSVCTELPESTSKTFWAGSSSENTLEPLAISYRCCEMTFSKLQLFRLRAPPGSSALRTAVPVDMRMSWKVELCSCTGVPRADTAARSPPTFKKRQSAQNQKAMKMCKVHAVPIDETAL